MKRNSTYSMFTVFASVALTLAIASVSKAGLMTVSDDDLAMVSGAGCGTCTAGGQCATPPADTKMTDGWCGDNESGCDGTACGNTYGPASINYSCVGQNVSQCNTTSNQACYTIRYYHCVEDKLGACSGCIMYKTSSNSSATTCTYK